MCKLCKKLGVQGQTMFDGSLMQHSISNVNMTMMTDDLTGLPLKHTCILAVTENDETEVQNALKQGNTSMISKSGITKRKSAIALTDENFYRKVSKYELDSNTVDWKQYAADRQRQITMNGKERQKVQGQAKQAAVQDEAVSKLMKIQAIKKEREQYI